MQPSKEQHVNFDAINSFTYLEASFTFCSVMLFSLILLWSFYATGDENATNNEQLTVGTLSGASMQRDLQAGHGKLVVSQRHYAFSQRTGKVKPQNRQKVDSYWLSSFKLYVVSCNLSQAQMDILQAFKQCRAISINSR